MHSFSTGDHPNVAPERSHRDANGNPLDRSQLAQMAVNSAFIGTAERVTQQLSEFIEQTGARRLALFHELVVDPQLVLASVSAFGERVLPVLKERFATPAPTLTPTAGAPADTAAPAPAGVAGVEQLTPTLASSIPMPAQSHHNERTHTREDHPTHVPDLDDRCRGHSRDADTGRRLRWRRR